MALTGLDIFKLLPKTNCGDCGVPTCLAFAMKLVAGQAELSLCPHVSEEAKEELSDAAAPPIRGVTLGSADYAFKIGEETVLFRHDKTFVNPSGFGIYIEDSLTDSEIEAKVDEANKLSFERVGQVLRANIIAVKSTSTPQRFV
ncbi:MAG: (Fe-S)-binding protein, partial [Candidatus Subteraquimicrobiales bacterium]|nr:(Fe-S)-binding protein [Candidatus Subteraquimicrobiales bacterium]